MGTNETIERSQKRQRNSVGSHSAKQFEPKERKQDLFIHSSDLRFRNRDPVALCAQSVP